MGKNREKSGVVAGILLPMGLVCLFAFCSLALALFGGQAYRQIQGIADDGYGSTVAASYLRTKLSQNNNLDAVALRQENGTDVLVITSAGEHPYETRIFMANGVLMELYVSSETPFEPSGGMQIATLARCDFSLDEEGLFTAEIESPAGSLTRACFALAKGGVV